MRPDDLKLIIHDSLVTYFVQTARVVWQSIAVREYFHGLTTMGQDRDFVNRKSKSSL